MEAEATFIEAVNSLKTQKNIFVTYLTHKLVNFLKTQKLKLFCYIFDS